MLIRLSSWMLCRFRADRARKASSTPMDLSFSGRFSFRLTSERFFPIIFFDIVPEAGPPQSPPSFPQRRLWSVWQLLYWMLLVVHTWLIKIIPLRLYTLIVHSSDNITVQYISQKFARKFWNNFFYSFFSADDTDVTKSHLTFRTSSLSGVKTLHCLHNSTCPLSVIDLWSSSTDTVDPSLFKQRPVYINQFEKPYWNSPVYVHTLLQGNVIINRFTKARRANSHSLP